MAKWAPHAKRYSLGKLSLDAAHVLLLDLSVPDLVLHLARLFRAAAEQQQARSEPVQPMNGAQILQVVLFGQDEDHRVVPVSTARMHLQDVRRNERHTEHRKNIKFDYVDLLRARRREPLSICG